MSENYYKWLGGFFDGEGSVHTVQANNVPVIQIAQKDPTPLIEIQQLFGGKIYVGRTGVSIYQIQKLDEIKEFCQLISPHTRIKKEKLEIALEIVLIRGGKCKERRSELAEKLASLRTGKKRGRKITVV